MTDPVTPQTTLSSTEGAEDLVKAHYLLERAAARDEYVGEREPLVSIAISLKRIADTLAGSPHQLGIIEHLLDGLATRLR